MKLQAAIEGTIAYQVQKAQLWQDWSAELTKLLEYLPETDAEVRYIVTSPGGRTVVLYVSGNAQAVVDYLSLVAGITFTGKEVATRGASFFGTDKFGIRWSVIDHPGVQEPVPDDALTEFGKRGK